MNGSLLSLPLSPPLSPLPSIPLSSLPWHMCVEQTMQSYFYYKFSYMIQLIDTFLQTWTTDGGIFFQLRKLNEMLPRVLKVLVD